MMFFKFILDMKVPEDLESFTDMPLTIEKRDKSTLWRLKFEASRICHHLFNKYGMVDYVNDDEMSFHKQLMDEFFEPLLDSFIKILNRRRTHFVGTKTLNFTMKFFSTCTRVAPAMEKIIPYVETIMKNASIPVIMLNREDVDTFENEPEDFVRWQHSNMDTLYNPKKIMLDLLIELCEYKGIIEHQF